MIRSLLAFAFLVPGVALAAPKAPASAPAGKATPAPTQKIEIEDELVDGTLLKPTFESTIVRKGKKYPSLIKVRASFVPEAIRSVQEL